jgi:hypothetical protein
MDTAFLTEFFLWMSVINFAILLWWFFLFSYKKEFIKKLHGIWFSLDDATFDSIHYKGMAYFKIGIFLFNLAPFLALVIIA